MDLFLTLITPLLPPQSPSPYVFPVTSQSTLHPVVPSREAAYPNFLGLQHQIHPLHQKPNNHSVVNTTTQVSALQDVPLLPIDATAKVGLTLVDSAPLCTLPLRTAQPIIYIGFQVSVYPIPTNITTPVNVKLSCY